MGPGLGIKHFQDKNTKKRKGCKQLLHASMGINNLVLFFSQAWNQRREKETPDPLEREKNNVLMDLAMQTFASSFSFVGSRTE